MEFFALSLTSLPMRPISSLYLMSAFPISPFKASSLNVLEGSLRDCMLSGPIFTPSVSIFTQMVSPGVWMCTSLKARLPSNAALEKL